jgi:hypothetical protein
MNDILRALLTAAGILFPVVILIIGVSMVAVKRGEASHAGHHEEEESVHVTSAGGAAAKPAKAAAAVSDEISVPQILGLGLGLFVLTILALLAVSLVAHM